MGVFELADGQHGVFSTAQASEIGVATSTLQRWLGAHRIEFVSGGVYRVVGAASTWHQRVAVACLTIPDGLASHRCAARLWALDGFARAPVEVMTQRWRRLERRPDGIVVHETKDLVAADLDERHGIPCTSLVRTLVDLPAVAREFRAGQALDHASRHDNTILPRVRQRHREVARRGRNGTVVLRRLLLERGAGDRKVDSGFERRALRLIDASQLPRPVTQHMVRNGDFVAYLDIAWPDHMVGMECDSYEHHSGQRAHQWDRSRRRQLTALGWDIREFTWNDVMHDGPGVVADLRAALSRARRTGPTT